MFRFVPPPAFHVYGIESPNDFYRISVHISLFVDGIARLKSVIEAMFAAYDFINFTPS
jgi:hypothetical protein